MDIYTVSPDDKCGFIAQVRYESGGVAFSPNFKSEAEARAWIREQKRMSEAADRFERNAPRNWRDKR